MSAKGAATHLFSLAKIIIIFLLQQKHQKLCATYKIFSLLFLFFVTLLRYVKTDSETSQHLETI